MEGEAVNISNIEKKIKEELTDVSERVKSGITDVSDKVKNADYKKYKDKAKTGSQDVVDTWIEYKRENEINELKLRPHPVEFALYYDV